MAPEVYSIFVVEAAAVAVLLLITALLYRDNPQGWLFWWSVAWAAYLAHMPFGLQTWQFPTSAALKAAAFLLLLIAQTAAASALALLARRPAWVKPSVVTAGLAAGLFLLLPPWPFALHVVALAGYSLLALLAAALGWAYARTRNNVGGWLLVAALFSRTVHLQLVARLPLAHLDVLDTITAIFALSAGLVVALEEMRQMRQWRSAAGLLTATLAARQAALEAGVTGVPEASRPTAPFAGPEVAARRGRAGLEDVALGAKPASVEDAAVAANPSGGIRPGVASLQVSNPPKPALSLDVTGAARGTVGLDQVERPTPEQITSQMEQEICRLSGASFCRVLLHSHPAGGELAGTLMRIASRTAGPAKGVAGLEGSAEADPSPGAGVMVLEDHAELEAAGRALAESGLLDAGSLSRLNGLAVVPAMVGGQPLGVLAIGYNRPILASPEDLRAMAEVGRQMGVALESARLLEQIRQSHRAWMNTVDTIGDFLLVHNRDFRIDRVNRALAERLGRAPAELAGRLCREVMPGAGVRWQNCPFCEARLTAEQFDPDFHGYFLISTSGYPREEPSGVLHVVRDITDRKLAEEKYRHIFENVREGVFISRPDGRLLDSNEALARMLGYEREELQHVDIPKHYRTPEERLQFIELMERQGYVEDYEVRLRKKNGQDLLALETSFATRDETGRVIQYQGFLVDVTERKRAENELRRQNEILSVVNALTARMAQSLDTEAVLAVVVDEMRHLFGFDTASVYLVDELSLLVNRSAGAGYLSPLGEQLSSFRVAPEAVAVLRQASDPVIPIEQLGPLPHEVLDAHRVEGAAAVFVVPLRGPMLLGALVLASRGERILAAAEQNMLAALGRQVSSALENAQLYQQARRAYEDLQQTQEQLLQSEKMAALGQLVSGVAHELNNPLAAIVGYSQLLETHVTPKGAEYVQKLMAQARRTQKIIQNLLSFARQRKPERELLDLNRIVDETLLLRDYDMRVSNVELVREFAEGLPQVLGDRHQLEQVILNIVNNACDAILENKSSGRLEVKTFLEKPSSATEGPTGEGATGAAAAPQSGSASPGPGPAGQAPRAGASLGVGKGSQVVLEFSDDGPGMKEPHRVFDPFYTTKKVGQGTGLGLSICYGIIKEHGGIIHAENRAPHGATFRIRLPAGQ